MDLEITYEFMRIFDEIQIRTIEFRKTEQTLSSEVTMNEIYLYFAVLIWIIELFILLGAKVIFS